MSLSLSVSLSPSLSLSLSLFLSPLSSLSHSLTLSPLSLAVTCMCFLLQTDDPVCSEVDSSVMENLETCVGFELSGVLMEKIDSCKEK